MVKNALEDFADEAAAALLGYSARKEDIDAAFLLSSLHHLAVTVACVAVFLCAVCAGTWSTRLTIRLFLGVAWSIDNPAHQNEEQT